MGKVEPIEAPTLRYRVLQETGSCRKLSWTFGGRVLTQGPAVIGKEGQAEGRGPALCATQPPMSRGRPPMSPCDEVGPGPAIQETTRPPPPAPTPTSPNPRPPPGVPDIPIVKRKEKPLPTSTPTISRPFEIPGVYIWTVVVVVVDMESL